MAVMGAGVVVLIALLARRIAGDAAGLIAAVALAAAYPNLWLNDALTMSETLATAAGVAAILLSIYWFWDRPSRAVRPSSGRWWASPSWRGQSPRCCSRRRSSPSCWCCDPSRSAGGWRGSASLSGRRWSCSSRGPPTT